MNDKICKELHLFEIYYYIETSWLVNDNFTKKYFFFFLLTCVYFKSQVYIRGSLKLHFYDHSEYTCQK